uniref:NADH-ubiquinone oxidoreductase chain 2 n=1 Tax=Zyginella minuta TaxID=2769890 RepID=A0A7H0DHY7_9HEMI|nr:NADH dehydrogenase subunit 2 [Zyginella minuta]QNP08947.1 NADH dehydrogenase subunit 2 [Zyginella minuta]
MKKNFNSIMFSTIIMMSMLMAASSNNWIMIWCSLEIMLISFIPIMVSDKLLASESTIQYFIIQSISSSLLMMGVVFMVMKGDYNYLYVINMSLMIKMGVAPFHNWVLTVIEGLTLYPMFMMLTILKIAPLAMMSYTTKSLTMIILITMITGAILGINQNSAKKLIGYSSIYNMGLILSLIKNNLMWMFYLLTYSVMMIMLMVTFKKEKIYYINQMIIKESSIYSKMNLWINMLSMGGMPPLMGFMIKLMVIQMMIMNEMNILLVILITSSLLVMFFYLRMSFLSIMNFTLEMKTNLFDKSKLSAMFISVNMLTLPIILSTKMLT